MKSSCIQILRSFASKPTSNMNIKPVVYNRNPRNLERLRLARKPTGYGVDQTDVEYWHKLVVTPRSKFVQAELIHNTGKVVVEASTAEWAIRKYLYSSGDKQAYIVLGQVFAERCLESGILSFVCPNLKKNEAEVINKENETMVIDEPGEKDETKMSVFMKTLEEAGLILQEYPCFDIHDIWRYKREPKPWTVLED